MNTIKIYYLLTLFFLTFSYSLNANCEDKDHDHGSEVEPTNVGPDKGVLEASEHKGLKLTAEAIKTLAIETKNITGTGKTFFVPKASVVESKKERFVYVLQDGFYKGMEVTIIQKSKDTVQVEFEDSVGPNPNVVTKGASFLRNIQIDVFSGEEGGHHH